MEEFNIKDIQEAGINLEPCICKKCQKEVIVNFTAFKLPVAFCEHCGFIDKGYLKIKP